MRKIKSQLPYGTKFYLIDEYKTLYIEGRRFMIRHVIKNKQSCYFVEELGDYGNTLRVWSACANPREAINRIKGLVRANLRPYNMYTSSPGIINNWGQVCLDPKEV